MCAHERSFYYSVWSACYGPKFVSVQSAFYFPLIAAICAAVKPADTTNVVAIFVSNRRG